MNRIRERWVSVAICLIGLFVAYSIFSDQQAGICQVICLLPLGHSFIQLIIPERQLNFAVKLIRILYFVRNIVTPYLMFLSNYQMGYFYIRNIEELLLSVLLFLFETLCVFITLRHIAPPNNTTPQDNAIKLKNTFLFNCAFWMGLLLCVFLYFRIPETHDVFTSFFSDDAALLFGISQDDAGAVGGLNRALFTIFSILFTLYRLLLPAYLMVILRKIFSNHYVFALLSLLLILTQVFFVTERTMTTLVNMIVLGLFMLYLAPKSKLFIAIPVSLIGVALVLVILVQKSGEEGLSGMISGAQILSLMFQGYIPNLGNMQGVFLMPPWKFDYLLSDIYSMIPFRNSLLGFDFGPNTSELFRDENMAGGQIIPLVGQSYYHFGIFAPVLSVFLSWISVKAYDKRFTANNYVKYIYYVFLSVFAAITPCMYYFGIFGSTFLTGMLLILLYSVFNKTRES